MAGGDLRAIVLGGLALTFITIRTIVFLSCRTTKVGVSPFSLEDLRYFVNSSNPSESPSFHMALSTEISIKNSLLEGVTVKTTTATISYRGIEVGKASIPGRQVHMLLKDKFNVTIYVSSDKVSPDIYPQLGGDIILNNLSFVADAKFMTWPSLQPFVWKTIVFNRRFVVDIGNNKTISPTLKSAI